MPRWRLQVSPGERYSESALIRAKQALTASGHFARVELATGDGESPHELDVTFDVLELP